MRLGAVRKRISAACDAAGRAAEEVTLIAVTKTFPASDVQLLVGLGVTDVGENRDAEAAPKAAQCADLNLTWHFIGQLQTNKAGSVARYASFVHSVDRPRLIRALGAAARRAGRVIECLIEVSLDGDPEPGRGAGGPGSRSGRGTGGRAGAGPRRRDGRRPARPAARRCVRPAAGQRRAVRGKGPPRW